MLKNPHAKRRKKKERKKERKRINTRCPDVPRG